MATICPSITADNAHDYREQMERVMPFARRLHIDFADGQLAPVQLIDPGLAWWPEEAVVDVHLMLRQPQPQLETFIDLKPGLIIVHAEADGDFTKLAQQVHAAGIKVGVALLPETEATLIASTLAVIDHVLIFSGDLGHFGGHADLSLLGKASELKSLKPNLEIGWDGGVSDVNINALVHGGVDVFNVGGFIQQADDPKAAYATLKKLIEQKNTKNEL